MMAGDEPQVTVEQEFEVGPFRPEDAPGIVRLFESVYGQGYPIKVFYDAEALKKANETGEYYSIVARTPTGLVVGVQHLFRSAPYPSLYETGAGLVSREYRQFGANKRMLDYAYNQWVPKQRGIEQVFGEPVCNHPFMQMVVNRFGYTETALEVALMPAEAYAREQSAHGRVAALQAFRTYKPKPHTLYLPEAYEKELRYIYAATDDARTLKLADKQLPVDEPSQGNMSVFHSAGLARIAMHNTGSDFNDHIAALEESAVAQKAVVIQVWLRLGVPWAGSAVDILRRKGYFLGGALPRWFDEDGLLMQKLFVEPGFDSIVLHSDRSKEILGIVMNDWRRSIESRHSAAH